MWNSCTETGTTRNQRFAELGAASAAFWAERTRADPRRTRGGPEADPSRPRAVPKRPRAAPNKGRPYLLTTQFPWTSSATCCTQRSTAVGSVPEPSRLSRLANGITFTARQTQRQTALAHPATGMRAEIYLGERNKALVLLSFTPLCCRRHLFW